MKFLDILYVFVLVFFDYILVYSKGREEHREHVKLVFQCLRSKELIMNGGKCEFGVSSAAYLGHIITEEGVLVDEEKMPFRS